MMYRKLRNGEEERSLGPWLAWEATGECLMVAVCPQEVAGGTSSGALGLWLAK